MAIEKIRMIHCTSCLKFHEPQHQLNEINHCVFCGSMKIIKGYFTESVIK